jgi:hypothetical protein
MVPLTVPTRCGESGGREKVSVSFPRVPATIRDHTIGGRGWGESDSSCCHDRVRRSTGRGILNPSPRGAWSHNVVGTRADAILARLEAGTMPCVGAWPSTASTASDTGSRPASPTERKENVESLLTELVHRLSKACTELQRHGSPPGSEAHPIV